MTASEIPKPSRDHDFIDVGQIREYSRKFVKDREWKLFHTPKNLALGIMLEAAELSEIFQWVSEKDSYNVCNQPKKLQQVEDELGDLLRYLVELSDVLGIDLERSFWNKIRKTEAKYPVNRCKGRPDKYDAYEVPRQANPQLSTEDS